MQKTNDNEIYPVSAPNLSMRHFKAIICLTNFKSFLAASAYLRISQPGLTRIIQQAEQRLGFILFETSDIETPLSFTNPSRIRA